MEPYDGWPFDFLRGPVIDKRNTAREKSTDNDPREGISEKGREPRRDNVKGNSPE